MNGVKFTRAQGGLSRQLPAGDHISGLIVYGETVVSKTVIYSAIEMADKGITQASHPVLHYHISEFFRINDGATLYIECVATSDGSYTEAKTLQTFAKGSLRQLAICDFKTSISKVAASVGTLQTIAVELGTNNTPLSMILSMAVTTADMTSLVDLHTLNADRVSVVLGEDVGGKGNYLSKTNASLSCIGTVIGAISKADVHESIGWVQKQNLISSAYPKSETGDVSVLREMEEIGFCDGSKSGDYTQGQIQAIHDKGYLFMTTYVGVSGSYMNDSFTATALTSDYAYIENNRAVDKAIREVNRVLAPQVSGPAYIDPDTGKIAESTARSLEVLCEEQLDEMDKRGEISGYTVSIDPAQELLKTSKLEVVLKIVPVGTLRSIEVKIGLTVKK